MRVRFNVRDMPEPQPGEYYELWLMKDGERVRAGSFTVGPEGYLEANMMVPKLPGGYLRCEISSEISRRFATRQDTRRRDPLDLTATRTYRRPPG